MIFCEILKLYFKNFSVIAFAWNAKRYAIAFALLQTLSALSGISRNTGAKIYFTDHWTADIVHDFRHSVPVLKHMVVIRIRQKLSNFPFISKRYKAITMCRCKQPIWNSFKTLLYCNYLLRLYGKSIIILLANDLTNICSKASKIWLIVWVVYACNEKRLEEVEKLCTNECTLHRWPRSLVVSDFSRPYQ